MRNWNKGDPTHTEETWEVFRLPMRNWNCPTDKQEKISFIVFRLPMRNWNSSPSTRKARSQRVFRLPMRNWNILYHRATRASSCRFLDCLWGIETPIAWPNTLVCILFLDCLWGIETPQERFSIQSSYVVFRLPMRNWNPPGKQFLLRQGWFLDCLWGIETYPLPELFFCMTFVFRLPMRNWNPSLPRCQSPACLRF